MHYERYRGPYLHQLTLDHLRQQPKSWPDFFYAPLRPAAAGGAAAYNVPSHTLMLCERMEENLVHFLVGLGQRMLQTDLPSLGAPPLLQ